MDSVLIDSGESARVKKIFHKAATNTIKEASRYYPELDVQKATNAYTAAESYQEQVLRDYERLVELGGYIEAYTLLRMNFGLLSTEDLMKLHNKAIILTQAEVELIARRREEIDE